MILKQTIQRGRRERRSRGVLLLVRRAAEATENKAGRLFQYHAGKKKRPQILERTEDVIVRELIRFDLETPLSPNVRRRITPASIGCQTSSPARCRISRWPNVRRTLLEHSLGQLLLLTRPVPRQILLRRGGISRRNRNQPGEPILRQEHQPGDEDERGGQDRHAGGFQKDAE